MVTEIQKRTAQAIVNVFETGVARGDYGNVTVARGDPGHLTYGRSQTTLASGNLYLLIRDYCGAEGAAYAADLAPYLERLRARDLTLDEDADLRRVLHSAGDDPIMRQVQDRFFDRIYWAPSERAAGSLGIEVPLGVAVVYDSHIHGSWSVTRDSTIGRVGPPLASTQQIWITAYVGMRREWLASRKNPLLRKTVYRMDAFQALITDGKWDLNLPLFVRDVLIDEGVLSLLQWADK